MTNKMTAKEAVKQIKGNCYFASISEKTKEALEMAIKALEQQPCTEDYPTCTECEHYDKEKHYCPRFCQVIKDTLAEAQPYEDCISRKAVIELIGEDYGKWLPYAIMELPSVTPQRPKGKWEYVERDTFGYFIYKCSNCNKQSRIRLTNYCPNCGAEMSGGEEDETDN